MNGRTDYRIVRAIWANYAGGALGKGIFLLGFGSEVTSGWGRLRNGSGEEVLRWKRRILSGAWCLSCGRAKLLVKILVVPLVRYNGSSYPISW